MGGAGGAAGTPRRERRTGACRTSRGSRRAGAARTIRVSRTRRPCGCQWSTRASRRGGASRVFGVSSFDSKALEVEELIVRSKGGGGYLRIVAGAQGRVAKIVWHHGESGNIASEIYGGSTMGWC